MILSELLDLLFPPRCVSCSAYLESHSGACTACLTSVRLHTAFFCGKCRARLPDPKHACHKDSPFLLAIAASYRDPAVKSLVTALKFDSVRPCADALALLLSRYLTNIPLLSGAVVVPVPLGTRRKRLRGFNQAELIGERVAANLGLEFRPEWLRRVKETSPQTDLGEDDRGRNVEGAFTADPAVRGRLIVLLDDVVTSGATLSAAARALRAEGAKLACAAAAAGA